MCKTKSCGICRVKLVTLGVARAIVVVSPEVALDSTEIRTQRLDFGIASVHWYSVPFDRVISTYGCWSLSASLGGVTQDVPILITDRNFRLYLQGPSERRVACDKTPK